MNVLKLAIWTAVIIGLTPAMLLAMLNLASNISLARQMKEEAEVEHDGGSGSHFTHSYIQFGKTLRLEVATTLWPSICLFAGASACVVGLLFLIPRQSQFIEAGPFDKIQQHIEKVTESRSKYAYVVISPRYDEYTAISFSKGDDGHSLDFTLTKNEQVEPVLAFFYARGSEPVEHYVTEEDTEYESSHMSYAIDGNAEEVAAVCVSILTDVYGIGKDKALLYTHGK